MRREDNDYENMKKMAIDIYVDYNLHSLPLDLNHVCRKLNISLIPYSELDPNYLKIAIAKSKDAFYCPPTKLSKPIIFYNDCNQSSGRINLSIAHEIKHFVCNDRIYSEKSEDLAMFFGRYFLAPVPYFIYTGKSDIGTIMNFSGLSLEASCYAASNICHRQQFYGNKIVDYEVPLLNQLLEDFSITDDQIIENR